MKKLLAILMVMLMSLTPVLASAANFGGLDGWVNAVKNNTNTNTNTNASAGNYKNNVLRSDLSDNAELDNSYKVFGSSRYKRNEILSVTFLDTLQNMPSDAWDVSAAGNGSVMAWCKPNGELYDLFIAGDGGVMANGNCEDLFFGYWYVTDYNFNGCFHTENITTAYSMFSCNFDLVNLDLSSFDTSSLENTGFMFSTNSELMYVNLSGFDTSNVDYMAYMFSGCSEIKTLDLSSFDTGKVTSMSSMFGDCKNLKDLKLGSKFTVSADCKTDNMFKNCGQLSSSLISKYAKATPKPTAKPTVKPASKSTYSGYYDYYSLYVGDSGTAVYNLQERLIFLGYLAPGQADGDYGKRTAKAVHLFKQQNGISDYGCSGTNCVATADMQYLLHDTNPGFYIEPDFTLEFPEDSYMNWSSVSGNKLKFRVEVENTSQSRTITAFELRTYAEDIYGYEIYGDTYYYETTKKNVSPGATVKSDYFVVPKRNEIYKIYVGISRIVYSDGSVEEAYPVNYWYWTYTD